MWVCGYEKAECTSGKTDSIGKDGGACRNLGAMEHGAHRDMVELKLEVQAGARPYLDIYNLILGSHQRMLCREFKHSIMDIFMIVTQLADC